MDKLTTGAWGETLLGEGLSTSFNGHALKVRCSLIVLRPTHLPPSLVFSVSGSLYYSNLPQVVRQSLT